MPNLTVSLRLLSATIEFDTAGQITGIRLRAQPITAAGTLIGGSLERFLTRDEAAALVSAEEAAAFRDGMSPLLAAWQTALLGA